MVFPTLFGYSLSQNTSRLPCSIETGLLQQSILWFNKRPYQLATAHPELRGQFCPQYSKIRPYIRCIGTSPLASRSLQDRVQDNTFYLQGTER